MTKLSVKKTTDAEKIAEEMSSDIETLDKITSLADKLTTIDSSAVHALIDKYTAYLNRQKDIVEGAGQLGEDRLSLFDRIGEPDVAQPVEFNDRLRRALSADSRPLTAKNEDGKRDGAHLLYR